MSSPILIATDGAARSDGAIRLGLEVARSREAHAELISVVEPIPRYGVGFLPPFPEGYVLYDAVQGESRKQGVKRQLERLGLDTDAPIVVGTGAAAPTIARRAREIGAELIVVGAGQHEPLERWLSGETALKVVRLAASPVLIVPQATSGLPRRVMVAVDFSEFSLRAARAVTGLLGDDAHVLLVHMMWGADELTSLPSLAEWRRTYVEGARARLDQLAEELKAAHPVTTESMVATGDPAEELLAIASRMNVDLIAAGSHGYGFLGRITMGSVSTRLIRGAPCPVLAIPPETFPEELRTDQAAGGEAHDQPAAVQGAGVG